MPFFEDAHAVRALAVACDMTGQQKYLDACRCWSGRRKLVRQYDRRLGFVGRARGTCRISRSLRRTEWITW